jgi:acyl dehydratase/NAD(P)-dependent dehydrogenase (short-subunit alcohol dehydrogenase family)
MTTVSRWIGEKTFSQQDQQTFAGLSHDCNPMHMDPIFARRLLTGRQVVHGIHVLISAIECWNPGSAKPVVSIACNFSNPISVGERIVFTQTREQGDVSIIEAVVNGLVCAHITLSQHRDVGRVVHAPGEVRNIQGDEQLTFLDGLLQPLNQAPEAHQGKRYGLRLQAVDVSVLFPQAAAHLGSPNLVSLFGLSYIVGMVCPGLHSVFSSFELELETEQGTSTDGILEFSVRKYDARFRLFDIRFSGPVQGSLKAFQRPPAQVQPAAAEFAKLVAPTQFKGTKSLIIGGSRGLGEVTAKLLAAGGGDTVITYAIGQDDANTIADDINSSTETHCTVVRLDLIADDLPSSGIEWSQFDAVYFFATPKIFTKKSAVFDTGVFQAFYDFYVKKFYELCVLIDRAGVGKKTRVFLPSSTAVQERPKGMTEYAMAKVAAEILAQDINRSFEHVAVVNAQLPRLNTDQTATILSVASSSNVEILLPLISALYER